MDALPGGRARIQIQARESNHQDNLRRPRVEQGASKTKTGCFTELDVLYEWLRTGGENHGMPQ